MGSIEGAEAAESKSCIAVVGVAVFSMGPAGDGSNTGGAGAVRLGSIGGAEAAESNSGIAIVSVAVVSMGPARDDSNAKVTERKTGLGTGLGTAWEVIGTVVAGVVTVAVGVGIGGVETAEPALSTVVVAITGTTIRSARGGKWLL